MSSWNRGTTSQAIFYYNPILKHRRLFGRRKTFPNSQWWNPNHIEVLMLSEKNEVDNQLVDEQCNAGDVLQITEWKKAVKHLLFDSLEFLVLKWWPSKSGIEYAYQLYFLTQLKTKSTYCFRRKGRHSRGVRVIVLLPIAPLVGMYISGSFIRWLLWEGGGCFLKLPIPISLNESCRDWISHQLLELWRFRLTSTTITSYFQALRNSISFSDWHT